MARIHRRTIQKYLHDPDNHDGVITHLESDSLKCEVKWALGSITMNKASGDEGIPVELFQILKDDSVKVLHAICQQGNLENSAGATGLETASFHSNLKGQHQRMFILPRNCTQLTLAKQYSKCSKRGFNSTGTINFQMFKLGLEKAEEPQIKLPATTGLSKKQESSGKTSTSALLSMPMFLTVDHSKLWKILKEIGIPDHLICLLRNLYAD